MALLRQSEAISDNRWQNLENNSDLINLKHIVFVINIFPLSAQAKGGSKSFVWWDQRILCRPLIVFFADERKLTTLSQSASAPSCQDNHHSQCNPTICEQCLTVTMARFYLGTAEIFRFVIATNNKGSSKMKKDKKGHFHFLGSTFPASLNW